MCAIFGFHLNRPLQDQTILVSILNGLIQESTERGRDSAGIAVRTIDGKVVSFKTTGHPRTLEWSLPPQTVAVIGNTRAEPTTEFIPNKTSADVQPFEHAGIWAVHNGTIANDKEFKAELSLQPPTNVDSWVIPVMLARERFQDLVGSMAVAWLDEDDADDWHSIYLYRNYKPIRIFYNRSLGVSVFCSMAHHFAMPDFVDFVEIDFPPYASAVLGSDAIEPVVGLEERKSDFKKGVVICSGGLDSTTVARLATQECDEVTLLHFMYGCRAESREVKAVQDIAQVLGIEAVKIEVPFLRELGGSSLTDFTETVAEGEAGAEYAHEWVPARNTVLIALTAAYCDRHNIGHIYLGLNLEEGGAYPDNTVEFYQTFTKVLDVGTQARPVIVNPLGNLMKHEIVKLALEIEAPIDRSWSCYHGGEIHCGNCGPCYLRRKAFKMNGIEDMVPYAVESEI